MAGTRADTENNHVGNVAPLRVEAPYCTPTVDEPTHVVESSIGAASAAPPSAAYPQLGDTTPDELAILMDDGLAVRAPVEEMSDAAKAM